MMTFVAAEKSATHPADTLTLLNVTAWGNVSAVADASDTAPPRVALDRATKGPVKVVALELILTVFEEPRIPMLMDALGEK